MGVIETYNGIIIYEDNHRGNIWKEYLGTLYFGSEFKKQEIEHEEEMCMNPNCGVLREE